MPLNRFIPIDDARVAHRKIGKIDFIWARFELGVLSKPSDDDGLVESRRARFLFGLLLDDRFGWLFTFRFVDFLVLILFHGFLSF